MPLPSRKACPSQWLAAIRSTKWMAKESWAGKHLGELLKVKHPLLLGAESICAGPSNRQGPDNVPYGYIPIPFMINLLKPSKRRILKYLCWEGIAMVNVVPLPLPGRNWRNSKHHGMWSWAPQFALVFKWKFTCDCTAPLSMYPQCLTVQCSDNCLSFPKCTALPTWNLPHDNDLPMVCNHKGIIENIKLNNCLLSFQWKTSLTVNLPYFEISSSGKTMVMAPVCSW